MKFLLLKIAVSASFGLAAAATLGAEPVQSYPSKPITIVVAQGAGGSTDIDTRQYAERLGRILGQPVVVENKPGAGGLIGNTFVARAAPDGYTLLATSTSITITPSLRKNPPFDLLKDFVPVSQLSLSPTMLVVGRNVPVTNLAEYIAYAKAKPGGVNFAAAGGVGAYIHLSGEWLHSMIKSKATIVQYPGAPAAMVDLTSGRLDATISSVNFLMPFIAQNKVRPIAVSSAQRIRQYPGLPTLAEQGLAGFNSTFWVGFLAPAGTPPAIVNKLSKAFAQIAQLPDVAKKLEDNGQLAVGNTPEEFGKVIRDDVERWGAIVREANITLE